MGFHCEAEGFYRKNLGECGSIVCPETKVSRGVYCEKCRIKAVKTKIGEDFSLNVSDRGSLETTWDIIEIECKKCGAKGKVTENYNEKDVTYYSNEEIRVYNK